MSRPGSFRGWVIFEGEAHALYENDSGPVYWCGGVLYTPAVTVPTTDSITVTFCSTCTNVVTGSEIP